MVGSFNEFPIGESIIQRNFVGVSDAEHEEYDAFATYARSGNIGAAWMSVIDADSGQVVCKKHQAIVKNDMLKVEGHAVLNNTLHFYFQGGSANLITNASLNKYSSLTRRSSCLCGVVLDENS